MGHYALYTDLELFVLTFLDMYKSNIILVFILGIIITSVLEYITSFY